MLEEETGGSDIDCVANTSAVLSAPQDHDDKTKRAWTRRQSSFPVIFFSIPSMPSSSLLLREMTQHRSV